jgi:hypothetical protein
MSYARQQQNRDLVEPAIVEALERVGFHVYRSLPVDLLVWKVGWNYFKLLEVKDPHARLDRRQAEQQEFLALTKVPIVRSIDDALRAVGAIR